MCMRAMHNMSRLPCLGATGFSRTVCISAALLQCRPASHSASFSSANARETTRDKSAVHAASTTLFGPGGALAASVFAAAVYLAPSAAAVALDKLPPLPFAADALEPYIDTATMQIHHDNHHQTYITKLQTALRLAPTLKGRSLEELNKAVGTRDVPSDVTTAIRNNGGGHWNHSFFWTVLTPAESKEADYQAAASAELKQAIEDVWGSLNAFQAKFNEAATAVFGSGWAWLGVDDEGHLVISTTSNQDNPLMKAIVKDANTPILGLDVWEHAYYLKYQNKRPDYLNGWWHLVNWKQVSQNYELANAGKASVAA